MALYVRLMEAYLFVHVQMVLQEQTVVINFYLKILYFNIQNQPRVIRVIL